MSKVVIYGGGTINHLRNHLGLCAFSRGTTARKLKQHLPYADMRLTFMGSETSNIVTNDDLEADLRTQLADPYVKYIIMSSAICDFVGSIGGVESGSHARRLETSKGSTTIEIEPACKLIGLIKSLRPDIYVVGFKTTTGEPWSRREAKAVQMVNSGVDIVLVNDTVTRNNMLVDEYGCEAAGRDNILESIANTIISEQGRLIYEDDSTVVIQLSTRSYLSKQEAFEESVRMYSVISKSTGEFTGGQWSSKQDGAFRLMKGNTNA